MSPPSASSARLGPRRMSNWPLVRTQRACQGRRRRVPPPASLMATRTSPSVVASTGCPWFPMRFASARGSHSSEPSGSWEPKNPGEWVPARLAGGFGLTRRPTGAPAASRRRLRERRIHPTIGSPAPRPGLLKASCRGFGVRRQNGAIGYQTKSRKQRRRRDEKAGVGYGLCASSGVRSIRSA